MNNLKATLQKSYYGKARTRSEGDNIILTSYNTDVLSIDKKTGCFVKLWNGWSVTTSKHINDFLIQNGFEPLSKKEWLALPSESGAAVYSMYYSNGFYTHKSNALLTAAEAEAEAQRVQSKNSRLYVWYE